ncbi:High-affinity branched-chain amino acid transport ATP-binding protein LivF [bacterium HR39]|nr:High-affinity branched-chain amino acid transport ATP-binding protein LivF [bacterium HR39]
MSLLELSRVVAGYGETTVLHGLSLRVEEGEVLALLGRNGMGKTTTLRAVMGLVPLRAGRILFDGRDLARLPTPLRARAGIAYVPETRDVFPSLTVRENLELAWRLRRRGAPSAWDLDRVHALFPRLRERADTPGRALSGGEQQMLAIARALLQNPRLLLLDEPTEGLAPLVVADIRRRLYALAASGLTVVLVEQNLAFATRLARRCCVLQRGRIVWEGEAGELAASEDLAHALLGVGASGRKDHARAGAAPS